MCGKSPSVYLMKDPHRFSCSFLINASLFVTSSPLLLMQMQFSSRAPTPTFSATHRIKSLHFIALKYQIYIFILQRFSFGQLHFTKITSNAFQSQKQNWKITAGNEVMSSCFKLKVELTNLNLWKKQFNSILYILSVYMINFKYTS